MSREIDRLADTSALGNACVEYTPADADLPEGVKAVHFDADGTIVFKNAAGGAAITGYPVLKGQLLPFVPRRITAMSGATRCYLVS
jgi:hypothetical protein